MWLYTLPVISCKLLHAGVSLTNVPRLHVEEWSTLRFVTESLSECLSEAEEMYKDGQTDGLVHIRTGIRAHVQK